MAHTCLLEEIIAIAAVALVVIVGVSFAFNPISTVTSLTCRFLEGHVCMCLHMSI
jgi:hypothetical protein